MHAQLRFGSMLLVAALASGCASTAEPVPEIRPGVLAGYLSRQDLPDSLALVSEVPSENSMLARADVAMNEAYLQQQGDVRWEVAARDSVLAFPAATESFQCELGIAINEAQTPSLYRLMRRSLVDAGLSTYAAKNHYKRARPFMVNGKPTCTPDDEAQLSSDGSYPSGHAAIGWAWSLLLAELAPERASALLVRGREFGTSRAVCNVHWPSDVAAGQMVGAAAVSVLHTDRAFQRDMRAARDEIAAVRAAGPTPPTGCDR